MTPPMTPREKVARIIDPAAFLFTTDELMKGDTSQYDALRKADAVLTALASGSGDHAELARLAEAASLHNEDAILTEKLAHVRKAAAAIEPAAWAVKAYKSAGDAFYKYTIEPGPEGVPFGQANRAAAVALEREARLGMSSEMRALLAENAALRGERDRAEERIKELAAMFGVCDGGRYLNDWMARRDRFTEAERKLAEAVDDERARGQVIIDERDKWIVELISERDEARAILRDAVSEAVPDAMIFAGHTDARRYSIALDDLRNWTARARTFLSKEAERG